MRIEQRPARHHPLVFARVRLADFSRHRYRLRADCLKCKRVSVLDPLDLLQRCQAKGWSYQLEAVRRRMTCAECGSREVRLGPAFGD